VLVDLLDELIPEFHHPRKLDFRHAVAGVAFVASNCLILVVVSKNSASAIGVAVVERIPVAAWMLWIVGLDNFR
jgi:hypothetical protein